MGRENRRAAPRQLLPAARADAQIIASGRTQRQALSAGPRPSEPGKNAPAAARCPPPPNVLARALQSTLGVRLRKLILLSAIGLLDKDRRHFDSENGQRQIHHVFGVGGQCAGSVKILAQGRGVGQAAVEFGLGAARIRPRNCSRASVSRSYRSV